VSAASLDRVARSARAAPASVHVGIFEGWMLDASRTRGSAFEVFTGQGSADTESCASSFCGSNDCQLDVCNDVASDEHAGDAGRFVLTALDTPVSGKLAAQGLRER
jgi:hypothetical protein